MNAKDAIIAKKKKKVERVEAGYIHHLEQGPRPKKIKMREKRDLDAGRQDRPQDDIPTTLPWMPHLTKCWCKLRTTCPWYG